VKMSKTLLPNLHSSLTQGEQSGFGLRSVLLMLHRGIRESAGREIRTGLERRRRAAVREARVPAPGTVGRRACWTPSAGRTPRGCGMPSGTPQAPAGGQPQGLQVSSYLSRKGCCSAGRCGGGGPPGELLLGGVGAEGVEAAVAPEATRCTPRRLGKNRRGA
jgi:hypothetical protein